MCCFTRPVLHVSKTNIFARTETGNRQFLVYSMTVSAKEDLAMVLPLPVAKGTGERDVHFINLKSYPTFFNDFLKEFFPPPAALPADSFLYRYGDSVAKRKPLEVIPVGEFEASYVPSLNDFDRLDKRFRLPAGVWKKLPAYKYHGFAVFKLKEGARTIHPMAFSFPRRDPYALFFPTLHIHDGDIHEKAEYDHTLYCQEAKQETLNTREWRESFGWPGRHLKVAETKGVVSPEGHCYWFEFQGQHANGDVFLDSSRFEIEEAIPNKEKRG